MHRPFAVLALLALVGCAHAAPSAPRAVPAQLAAMGAGCKLETGVPMYRVFRGMRRADVTREAFLKDLGARFIPAAPKTHGGKGLVAYLPAVPPADAPAGTPDEVAIVIYASEAVYQERRNSPEGRAYGDMHWELFDRPTTKSDTAVGLAKNGPELAADVPVDVLEKPTDWQCGWSTVYIGKRKAGLAAGEFLPRLARHVALAKSTLEPMGLRGYVVVANEEREVAWLNWPSKHAADKAFASAAGKALVEDGGQILETVMWTAAAPFKGDVAPGQAFNVKFRR